MEEQAQDIGSTIKQKIAESVQNIDVLSMIQRMVAETPADEESEEIRSKLQGVLDQYNQMNEDEQGQFKNQIQQLLASKVAMKLSDHDINLDGIGEAIGEAIMYRLIFVGVGVLILILVLVFFGYKLYKSIKDKEVKREEKKKAKQMKKKK